MTYPTDAQIAAALEKLPRGVTTAQGRAALIAAHEAWEGPTESEAEEAVRTWQPTDKQVEAALETLNWRSREHWDLSWHSMKRALIAAHEADRQEMLEYFASLKPEIEAMTAKGVSTKTLSQFRSEVIAKAIAQARAQAFHEASAACGRMRSATGSVLFGDGCAACADAISAIAAAPAKEDS